MTHARIVVDHHHRINILLNSVWSHGQGLEKILFSFSDGGSARALYLLKLIDCSV